MLINSQKSLPLLTVEQNLNESQQKIARKNLGEFTSENFDSDSVSQEFYGILAAEWIPSDRNTYFTQTVTVDNIPIENCKYIITYSGKDRTHEDQLVIRNYWGNIFQAENEGDKFTFYSESRIDYAIPFKILVVKK